MLTYIFNRNFLFTLLFFLLVWGCAKQTTESENQAPVFFHIEEQAARASDGHFPPINLNSFVQDETAAANLEFSAENTGSFSASIDVNHLLTVSFPVNSTGSQIITIRVRDEEGLEALQTVKFSVFNMEQAENFQDDGTMEIQRNVSELCYGEVWYGSTPNTLTKRVKVLGNPHTNLVIPLKAVLSNTVYYYRWEATTTGGALLERSPVDSFRTLTVESPPLMRLTAIDVRQGDGNLIRTPNGKLIMIDGGYGSNEPSFGRDPGQSWDGDGATLALNYLRSQNITHLDAIVETHHHADHYGGLRDVTAGSSGVSYGQYLSPDSPLGLTPGAIWDVNDPLVTVKCFNIGYPNGNNDDNENNRSVVLKFSFGEIDMLTTGDAEQPVEAFMMNTFGNELRSEILKVDHHGSSDATTDNWIATVAPVFAVISVAANNPYGHPHSECLDALYNHNVEILRTDYNGTVDFVTDGMNVIEAWY